MFQKEGNKYKFINIKAVASEIVSGQLVLYKILKGNDIY